MQMLPRERVLAALDHRTTDRVPLDFWATPEVWAKLKAYFQNDDEEWILRRLGIDIRQFQPEYTGPMRSMPDGTYFDKMGIHRRLVHNTFCAYEEYASFPLGYAESAEDLDRYAYWPDIAQYDFSHLSEQIGNTHKTYYIKLETGGLFELAWALRGYERFLMDMMTEPEICHYIMGKLTDFYCEYVRRAMEAAGDKYDMVYTYDDIATQRSLLISPEKWAELIRPYHVKLNAVIHGYGKKVMYHSCGAVYKMIGELMRLPIDVLNPIQPGAVGMDLELIKKTFGQILCFHGGIDIQTVLPHGTLEDVKKAVDVALSTLGRGGGYILTSTHYLQADAPVENILAMYDHAMSVRSD